MDLLSAPPSMTTVVSTLLAIGVVAAVAGLVWQCVRLRDRLLTCERGALNDRANLTVALGKVMELQAVIVRERLAREQVPWTAKLSEPPAGVDPPREVWPGCGPV